MKVSKVRTIKESKAIQANLQTIVMRVSKIRNKTRIRNNSNLIRLLIKMPTSSRNRIATMLSKAKKSASRISPHNSNKWQKKMPRLLKTRNARRWNNG